jgi:hypothetical protein
MLVNLINSLNASASMVIDTEANTISYPAHNLTLNIKQGLSVDNFIREVLDGPDGDLWSMEVSVTHNIKLSEVALALGA